MSALRLVEQPGGCLLSVKVSLGASKNAVVGLWGDRLKVSVQAPPERGKANEEVVELLANLLRIRRAQVAIVQGHASAKKTVRIAGLSVDQVMATLRAELS